MILLSLGKKASGKSTLLRRLAYQRLARSTSAIFWVDLGNQVRGGRVFTSVAAAREYIRAHGLPRLSIFRGVDSDEVAALAIEIGDVTLVVDELDLAAGGKVWKSPAVKRIVHHGRHHRVDLWGGFRSTRNVSEDLLGQADAVFLMRHNETGIYDLDTIRRRFGDAYANVVTRLDPMQFVLWQDA